MFSIPGLNSFVTSILFSDPISFVFPLRQNVYSHLETTSYGDVIFELGNVTYLANVQQPKATLRGDYTAVYEAGSTLVPSTVIVAKTERITKGYLEETITSYIKGDDVYTKHFLDGLHIISSSGLLSVLDSSALDFLARANVSKLFLDKSFRRYGNNITGSFALTYVESRNASVLPAGPFAASISPKSIAFASVYRLYPDRYRDFLFGVYDSNDGNGTYNAFGTFLPKFWDPMIPVPSRLYSWGDERPLAGERVAIKDLFDIKGLQTSGGSQAWATITPISNGTAPAIQQIIDLGGVLVGKYKLAQFASGANPWDWQDEHYPWNPRGDGYLTCSSSSSGGGCSIAAYDWLDYAIGSDTGSSMRRPAAVSGTYGNRPSQGMMNLERVLPLGDATDTTGVFSRDPRKWVKFAKAWYTPSLHQDSNITGLPTLVVTDNKLWPKRILYPVDYFPLANPAAEAILQRFLGNMTRIFNMKVEKFNFRSTFQASNDWSELFYALNIINSYHQYQVIVKPLITAWAKLFEGRFPPVDPQWRKSWKAYDANAMDESAHKDALIKRAESAAWAQKNLFYSTNESCSESMMVLDIGTGGLPSFREKTLMIDNPAASFLAVTPSTTPINEAAICPALGCADYTVPIGQVSYFSNVTFHIEYMPVTINLVVGRGCDFMLFNMIEKLAEEGVLTTVKTGRIAF